MRYGGPGIDTTYERKKIAYLPEFSRQTNEAIEHIPEEQQILIQRSNQFSIYKSQAFYDDLLLKIDDFIKETKKHLNSDVTDQIDSLITSNSNQEIFSVEKSYSKYNHDHWVESYVILLRIQKTVIMQKETLKDEYQSKFGMDPEKAERESMDYWIQRAYEIDQYYEGLYHDHDHDIEQSDDNREQVEQMEIEEKERERQKISLLHETMADVGYVHQNRYFMFDSMLEEMRDLIFNPGYILGNQVKEMLYMMGDLPEKKKSAAHLIESFNKKQKEHEKIKHKIIMHDDEKERFISNKNSYYQELYIASEDVRQDLMYKEEVGSEAFNEFAEEMVDSLLNTKHQFIDSTTDMIQMLKVEYNNLENQLGFIEKKEKMRRYIQILLDLKDKATFDDIWASEYIERNGYKS